MTGTFSGVAWRNCSKLEVNVVKLSLQDRFVLEFKKVVPFLYTGCRQEKGGSKIGCFASKFNRGHKTEEA